MASEIPFNNNNRSVVRTLLTRACILSVTWCLMAGGWPPQAEAANILMIHPVVSRSHELIFITLGEALARGGHNVTLVRFKGRSRMPTRLVHSISLDLKMPADGRRVAYVNEDGEVEPPHELLWNRARTFQAVPLDIVDPVLVACETLFHADTEERLQLRGSGARRYDIVIVDLLFNACGMALADQLGLPVVAYWATIQSAGELFWTSSVLNPSVVPGLLTEFSDRMSFHQRALNALFYMGARLFSTFVMIDPAGRIIARHFPDAPHPTELVHNISLLLINSDFTLDFARPITPNTVYIGCIQCHPPNSLDTDLEQFMQSSGNEGVVVFSLGATFSEGGMPLSAVREIYDAFSRCKQKFILKMAKNSPNTTVPSNVRIVEWLPQQDILGHPKTRLFITHCGMHGVLEALYHAVPMVGIPIFGDQGDVLVRLQIKGVAVGLDKQNLTAQNLYDAIQTVLYNQSFKTNAQKLSRIIRDQPQSALERSIFWIEYIIRHRGAPHLKTSDRFLNIVQYLLLDVIALFVSTGLIAAWICKWLVTKMWRKTKQNHVHQQQNGNLKRKKIN